MTKFLRTYRITCLISYHLLLAYITYFPENPKQLIIPFGYSLVHPCEQRSPKIGVCGVLALHACGGTPHTPILGIFFIELSKSYNVIILGKKGSKGILKSQKTRMAFLQDVIYRIR